MYVCVVYSQNDEKAMLPFQFIQISFADNLIAEWTYPVIILSKLRTDQVERKSCELIIEQIKKPFTSVVVWKHTLLCFIFNAHALEGLASGHLINVKWR